MGIVGAGPAGLTLAHLLKARGIDTVVLEARDREYVEHRVRAGVLEHPTVDLLRDLGLAGRLDREGLRHDGIALAFDGERHRIDFAALVGRAITVYGQQEVVKDLIAARLEAGDPLVFEAADVRLLDVDGDTPRIRYVSNGVEQQVRCDVIAGCDGFHGVCRRAIPPATLGVLEHEFPFSWLGILVRATPTTDELIYANHARGFALYSMRSATVTRLYLQVGNDDRIENWSDDRIWSELATRLPTRDGFVLEEGPILDRGITPMHAFVAAPMQWGSLVLAGDAAHIVPPTGAKGMNLAIADVAVLADVLDDVLNAGRRERLADYSAICARRVWRAQHFSWWMTSMLHRLDESEYRHQLQLAELRFTVGSDHASRALAENYVGLPFGWGGS